MVLCHETPAVILREGLKTLAYIGFARLGLPTESQES
jgi:hypothetical protein